MRPRRPKAYILWIVVAAVSAAGCVESVEVPGRSTLLDVGPDWLLLLERDTLGVEYVVVHPFEREGEVGG